MSTEIKEGPDKGWSWVIAFAACFNSLVLAGIFRTSGVLFVAFISEYGVSREEASWPVVLCISVLNLTGIITGPLGLRYGVRPVVIVGSLVATIGISSCYFTTSLRSITLLFGVVFGIGYGLVSTLMPIIVNEYFLNHRATANGIANSGSCFGSIILPPLFEYFIDIYGLSGCFLLTGGIVLHIAITGALMRPPQWLQKSKKIHRVESFSINYNTPENFSSYSEPCGYDAVIRSIERRNSRPKFENEYENRACLSDEKTEDRNGYSVSYDDDVHHQDLMSKLCSRPVNEMNDLSAVNEPIRNPLLDGKYRVGKEEKETDSVELHRSIEDLKESLGNFQRVCAISVQRSMKHKSCGNSNEPNAGTSASKSTHGVNLNEQSRHDQIFSITGNSSNLKNGRKIEIAEKAIKENNMERESANAYRTPSFHEAPSNEYFIPNKAFTGHDYRTSEIDQNNECISKINQMNSTKLTLNIQNSFRNVLTCPMFYVTALTNVSFYFLFHMYVVIIVDFSLDRGVPDKDTKYVLFGFALFDLIGRLCLGWITDRNFLKRSHFVMGCMALIGITFFIFPFANGYIWLILVSCLYGLLLGCTMIVFPILLVDYLGLEIQAVAYGCMCFMNGLVSLTRPFLIGYFRDNIGSYSNIFFLLGGIALAASFLWLLENYFVKNQIPNADE